MIWIFRLQRLFYTLIFTALVYGLCVYLGKETITAGLIAFGAFLFFALGCWIEMGRKFKDPAGLNTNRHAFKSIQKITHLIPRFLKYPLAMSLGSFLDLKKGTGYGLGGSAAFASVFNHWRHRYKQQRGDIFLGVSPWDRKTFIGHNDDKAMVTFSEPRNGKGTSCIIPNLFLYPGSVLCIDPKGENAKETAAHRKKYGRAYVVDPFGVSGIQGACFNPLADLDPNSDDIVDDIRLLTDSIVVRTGDKRAEHFDEGGADLVAAGIGHLITSQRNANLADLRDFIGKIRAGDPALLSAMRANDTCSGIIRRAADTFSLKTTEISNFVSVADKNTKWLDSPKMRAALERSDFSFRQLKSTQGTSVYLVLEGDKLRTHARFLRLFVNLALRSMRKGAKPKIPVLFILDEFYALGRMDQLLKEANEIPGYGVKLWPIMHSIDQLKDLYGDNWRAFLGGLQQYFGLLDATAGFVGKQLGVRGFDRNGNRDDRIQTELLTATEIRALTSREKGNQIIIRSDFEPLLLERVPYYIRLFKKLRNGAKKQQDRAKKISSSMPFSKSRALKEGKYDPRPR